MSQISYYPSHWSTGINKQLDIRINGSQLFDCIQQSHMDGNTPIEYAMGLFSEVGTFKQCIEHNLKHPITRTLIAAESIFLAPRVQKLAVAMQQFIEKAASWKIAQSEAIDIFFETHAITWLDVLPEEVIANIQQEYPAVVAKIEKYRQEHLFSEKCEVGSLPIRYKIRQLCKEADPVIVILASLVLSAVVISCGILGYAAISRLHQMRISYRS